ncbi:alpha-amylase family glycosyl hydrolase [Ornithinimicrobium sp. W1665]|uniref:alpha-amylase family glycosyl hydrolase n=1 Tax=Ornithinimicrobium sp. W1665 TaxID=3416666 RepID=UPI003D6A3933
MRITDTSDLWWKNAILYSMDVETFYDADGDGVGDIQGLAQRIDYLADLGITCLWLMPFYPSPDRDDGYDVMDYYGVDGRLGNHGQFVELVRLAHDRGIRVITDLVINHTSDQHPWFKASRKEKDPEKNYYRDFYVWRPDDPGDTSDQVVFPDEEDSIWELDEKTGEYYLHHFYKHQPDLNLDHPAVVDEIMRTVGFWLQLGVDGFRVDGVPFFEQSAEATGSPGVRRGPAPFHGAAARLPLPAQRLGHDARRGQPEPSGSSCASSAGTPPTRCTCSSTSSSCSGPTSRWPARTPGRSSRPCTAARRSTGPASGRPSCATTTSSPSTSSPRASARRSSPPSGRRRRCRSTTEV